MTIRAIIIGLLCVAALSGVTYFNDHVMLQTHMIGNSMPISVYGTLVVFLMAVYPVLRAIHRRLALSRAEISVILGMTLMACAVPGSNLMRLLTPTMVMPYRFETTEPGWQQWQIVQKAPPRMLVDVATNRDMVVNGFVQSLRTDIHHISIRDVPWRAWRRPLLFWVPCVLLLWTALICLGLMVHRQWAHHELLPYPIVSFVTSLLPSAETGRSPIFHNRLFLGGLVFAALFHCYNYSTVMWPAYTFEPLPRCVNLGDLVKLLRVFEVGHGYWYFGGWELYFSVVAIAYFIPNDVSLSLGLGPIVWRGARGLLIMYGLISTSWYGGIYIGVQAENAALTGAYLAMMLVILYIGRHHLATVCGRACGLAMRDRAEPTEIWSARVFVLAVVALVVYLNRMVHFDWLLALSYVLLCCAFYLVMGRLIAETGLFFIAFCGGPTCVFLAFLGPAALGPEMLLIGSLLSIVLIYDHREALVPYVMNALKLGDDCRVKPVWIALVGMLAVVVALGVAIPVQLYLQYDFGAPLDLWQVHTAGVPFRQTVTVMERLHAQGMLADAGSHTGFARLAHAVPHRAALAYFGTMFALVLLFSFLRARFTRWPFHPVLFLAMANYPLDCFGHSFMIGWFIKTLVTRYGGGHTYQKAKPLMFGLIAGEMLGGLIPMVISTLYYLLTRQKPPSFLVMPC